MNILHDIDDAIREVEEEDYSHNDWCVYIPSNRLDEINDIVTQYTPMEAYEKGTKVRDKRIIPDNFVDEPIVLPDDTYKIPGFETFENPPEKLIKQIANIESHSQEDHIRSLSAEIYTARPFYNLENEHRRVNRDKIDKYNFPISADYDKQPNVLERVKIGMELTSSDEMGDYPVDDRGEREIIKGIKDNIHNVTRTGVYEWRKRTIKGAYPVLDIQHRERIRVGTDYKHYGGVMLKSIDTQAQIIETRSGSTVNSDFNNATSKTSSGTSL